MKSLFFCLVFIFANTVLSQAADFGTVRVNTQKWITTYSGEAEVDGLPVTAHLDEGAPGLDIPDVTVGEGTFVPSLTPVVRKTYRLNLVVSESPRVSFAFPVVARTISIEGSPRFAFVSDLAANKDFHFVITVEAGGSLRVSYTRKVSDGILEGDFALVPVPHVLAK
jgi:hypothetical protein